jgi:ABC-2 type transport system permease protein
MGFFWTNLFEMGRNVRSGHFDFFMAQPGSPLFMVSTRKIDLDGFLNAPLALAVVLYACHRLGLHPSAWQIALYGIFVLCGLAIHYSTLLLLVSLVFWLQSAKGLEGGYFGVNEFSRLPRQALHGVAAVIFVYALPVIVVTNVPVHVLLGNTEWSSALWLVGVAGLWLAVAITVFNRGLRRYSSASS